MFDNEIIFLGSFLLDIHNKNGHNKKIGLLYNIQHDFASKIEYIRDLIKHLKTKRSIS